MRRAIFVSGIFTIILVFISLLGCSLQISQIEFDLHLSPGGSTSQTFLIINDESRSQEITVYLNDWVRTATGETDFFPPNDARWLFLRSFTAGERLELVYHVLPPSSNVTVTGTYTIGSPTGRGKIEGPDDFANPAESVSPTTGAVPVRIIRTITPGTDGGFEVRLQIDALTDFVGLRIDEVFSSHVTVHAVDSAGGEFVTVSRSASDWITVAPRKFTLAPGATQEVTFTVNVPATGVDGTYWGAILIEGSPHQVEREGATVLAVERFGVKVYVTITGTEVREGRVIRVRKVSLNPLTFKITFANTGNVQLRPTGTVTIISQSGETVRTIAVEEFPVLPGAVQTITVKDPSSDPLPPGIYRALVMLDYGGENPVGGTRDFRVK